MLVSPVNESVVLIGTVLFAVFPFSTSCLSAFILSIFL